MPLASGTKLGNYEICSLLGTGGMGEVYLAEDKRLRRRVAVKILPRNFAGDHIRVRRFVQEAQATAALNHPNIAHIYEIGESDEVDFIAMEFVDGITLRQQLNNKRMTITEAIDVSVQIAFALSLAHDAGIVHRDLKPENIMLRPDGIVKVLDFGLAKLSEITEADQVDSKVSTRALAQTEPGVVLGTLAYMSPEQARGLPVDARTDIFSLGVLLYEMIGGQPPFVGATKSDLIVALLERQPPPLSSFTDEVPAELERITMKALSKDREERYQTTKDLLVDLKGLKQKLEREVKIGRVAFRGKNDAAATSVGKQAADTRPMSRAEYLVNQIKRHRLATIVVILIVTAAAGIAAYNLLSQRQSATPFQATKISRLTTIGKVFLANVSPDWKNIAYVVDDGEQQSLWVKQVVAPNNLQLVPPLAGQYLGICFTPDGNYIDYVLFEISKGTAALYQVSALGGAPRKLLENVSTSITFSPDHKRFAFLRVNPNTFEYAVMIANADGSGEKKLTTRKLPDFYSIQSGPAWSPDGKTIACPAGSFTGGFHVGVVEVSPENGTERVITSHRWFFVGQPRWLKDGRGLVMTAKDRLAGPEQIWKLSYPGGEAKQLTNDLNDYRSLSLNADSDDIAAVQSVRISGIWIAPGADGASARKIALGQYESLAWTAGNKIVYASSESGNPDIWIMDADGKNHTQLTFDPRTDFEPIASPDGQYVVFFSDRAGSLNLWRMNADGSNLKQLTSGGDAEFPSFSPDGKWVVYSDFGHGKVTVWKVGIDDGDPVQVIDKASWSPVVSPNGKLIACYYAPNEDGQVMLAIIPFGGGPPVKTFNSISQLVRWSADGRSLTYIVDRAGVSDIWKQPLDGGAAVQATDFKSDRIFWFDWSRDDKQLALIRGVVSSDVVLISVIK